MNPMQRITGLVLLAVAFAQPGAAQQSKGDAFCAISRAPRCDPYLATKRGLIKTGLKPIFPKGAKCRKIDEKWAISYTKNRGRTAWHGGIDIPAPYGTPIIAAADGEVVAVFEGKNSFRGREIVLRHSPSQTGIPFLTFSAYSHFDAMPKFRVGSRIKRGQVLGPTGNSGRGRTPNEQSTKRRPAIHFSVVYGTSSAFRISKNEVVVPKGAYWTDPIAFLAGLQSLKSENLKALPNRQKRVLVGVKKADQSFVPPDAKIVWPYICR